MDDPRSPSKRVILLPRHALPLLVIVATTISCPAMAENGSGLTSSMCPDVLTLETGRPTRTAEFSRLLRATSLSQLERSACEGVRVTLQKRGTIWVLRLQSKEGAQPLEREVQTLDHAATWVETWLQSGFDRLADPAPDPRSKVRPVAPQQGASEGKPIQSHSAPAVAAAALAAIAGPGNPYLGAIVRTQMAHRQRIGLGAALGGAFQVGLGTNSFRRTFWAGPFIGSHVALSSHWHFSPQLGLGVAVGASSTNGVTNRSGGPYASLGAVLGYDLGQHLAIQVGIEGRAVATELLGSDQPSRSVVAQSDAEDEAEDSVVAGTSAVPPRAIDTTWVAMTLGLEWRWGGAAP